MISILFVDDEFAARQNFDILLKHHGYHVELAESVAKALSLLKNTDFDLIITDMRMAPQTGLDLLRMAKSIAPNTGVIVLTGHGEIQNAIEAMKLGALDYITKETDYKEILLTIDKALEKRLLKEEIRDLRNKLRSEFSTKQIIGTSEAIKKVIETLKRVASTDSRVLITGESGTGKELVAETIHQNSARQDAPFIAFNCGAIPKDLQESELFGHVKGAFTGAEKDRKGLFESAQKGTVFLDEVAEMSLETQVKLLRFLENGEFFQVGSSIPRKVDVRIISATNRNLESLVEKGSFRSDLYYRLKVVTIHLPALRERKEDIPLLAQHLLTELNPKVHTSVKTLSPEVLEVLSDYSWHGNVRELKNVIERALIFSDGDKITLESLPEELFKQPPSSQESEHLSTNGNVSLEDVEKDHIIEVLRKANGNKLLTAQRLGIATTTLYRKLRQYGIE
ncbi:MAG: sigma-54 dependent transcriptional regulator [Bacteroidota bacterium]|nr:sigma-54 dependent transcriptional regulator [Bacteroidota bacterium]MDP4231012.1 sigma-54 dependent transcriptional regulator [Bacteroidota bacterium]